MRSQGPARRLGRRGALVLPNLLTVGNLLCGFYAIVAVYNDEYVPAAVAIMIALLLDGLDGAVARVSGSASPFGVELDSLADVVSFGVAPAILGYVFALRPYDRIGWIAPCAFVACGALRLARFNVQTAKLDRRYFVGLPIPAAAAAVATFVLYMKDASAVTVFNRELLSRGATSAVVALGLCALAFLMVSKVRYRSLKGIEMRRRRPFALLIGFTVVLLVVASQPSMFLHAAFLLYALSGPLRSLPFRWLRRSMATVEGATLDGPRRGEAPPTELRQPQL